MARLRAPPVRKEVSSSTSALGSAGIRKKYILFLNEPDPYTHYYTSAFTPSLIEINPNNTVDLILPKRGVQKHRLEYNGNTFNVSVGGLRLIHPPIAVKT